MRILLNFYSDVHLLELHFARKVKLNPILYGQRKCFNTK